MRLLLDTHTFLWFIQGSNSLSNTARHLIEDSTNQKLVSTASLWEIAIKVSIGKLEIEISIQDLVERHIFDNAFGILSISPKHLNQLSTLPFYPKDPFDRLIIAQGLTEEISIIFKDKSFREYPIQLIW